MTKTKLSLKFALTAFGLVGCCAAIQAQKSPEGYWYGELHAASEYTSNLKFSKSGEKFAVFIDNPNEPAQKNIPVADVAVNKEKISFRVPLVRGSFEGVLSADNKSIDGKWTQYGYTVPVVYKLDSLEGATPIEGRWSTKRSKAKQPMIQLYKITKKESGDYESSFFRLDDVGQKVDNQKTFLSNDSFYMFDRSQAVVLLPTPNPDIMQGFAKVGRINVAFKVKRVNPDTLNYFHARPFKNGQPVDYVYRKPAESGDGWESGTITDAAFLDKMKDLMGAVSREEIQKVSGIAIARKGKLVMEEYFYQYGPQSKQDVGEITGNIMSALTGIAIDQEYIENVNEKAYSYFSDIYTPKEEERALKSQITIRHLMDMMSGLNFNDFDQGSKERLFKSKDWTLTALATTAGKEPGREFMYSSANLVMLGGILERATKQTVPEFSKKNLFEPLGIKNYMWDYAPTGEAITSHGLNMTLRDVLKFGQLYLNRGKWNGKQIVSAKWITESTTEPGRANPDESKLKYLWWNTSAELNGKTYQMYFANAFAGHKIFVIPELDLVFAVIGKLNPGSEGKLINKYLLPAVTSMK